MANDLNHSIRVVYDKKDGAAHLGIMEVSTDVSAVLNGVIPHFDPTASDPRRLHFRSILDAIDNAGMEVASLYEALGDLRYEVIFTIKQKRIKGNKHPTAMQS